MRADGHELRSATRVHQLFLASSVSGVKLALARYEHARVAPLLMTLAADDARKAGHALEVVDFAGTDSEVDIVGRLQHANASAQVVFVVGLEALLLEEGLRPRKTNAIARFNFDRDLLPERLHGIIVFWMSARAAEAFAELARDTFDVLATTFEFPDLAPSFRSRSSALDLRPDWMTLPARARASAQADRVEELRDLWHRLGDEDPTKADLANSLGKLESSLWRFHHALEWFECAAELAERRGDFLGATRSRRWRSWLWAALDDSERAERELDEASGLALRAGSRPEQLEVSLQRADILYMQARLDEALALLEPLRDGADERTRLALLARMADILRQESKLDESMSMLQTQVLPLAERVGTGRDAAQTWHFIALTFACQSRFDDAFAALRDHALPLFEQVGDHLGTASAKLTVADILYALGDYDTGLKILHEQVLPAFEDTDIVATIWRIHSTIAKFERAQETLRREQQEVLAAL